MHLDKKKKGLLTIRYWKKRVKIELSKLIWHFQLPFLLITNYNYVRKLKKIRKQDSINVAFLVEENSKWNGASLYQKLMQDSRFSPMVLVRISNNVNFENDVNYLFFKQRNYNVFAIANIEDLYAHKPDMVFYQQPWSSIGIRNKFSPFRLSKYALCLYFPYGIATTIEISFIWDNCRFFFKTLYKQFIFNSECVKQYESRGIHNVIATGHPQLDVYGKPVKSNPWQDLAKIKIIYAPHHAFAGRATFTWNGKDILQIAKNNPNTEWIFKPHPRFKKAIIHAQIMTSEEIDKYFQEWEQIGQIYDQGDYYDIFRTSDLMITDCNGFLTEYLPTGNPVIHLIPAKDAVWSAISQKSSRHYYKVQNLAELERTFDMLIKEQKDPLKIERQKDAAEITFNSADNIYNELLKILEDKQ